MGGKRGISIMFVTENKRKKWRVWGKRGANVLSKYNRVVGGEGWKGIRLEIYKGAQCFKQIQWGGGGREVEKYNV